MTTQGSGPLDECLALSLLAFFIWLPVSKGCSVNSRL